MTSKQCPKCQEAPCICRPFCPGRKQCCGPQQLQPNCAGPLQFTGEDDIGDRPCCGGLKKCTDNIGFRSWCSHDGTCPGKGATFDYPPAPAPFTQYYDFLVQKENYSCKTNKAGPMPNAAYGVM